MQNSLIRKGLVIGVIVLFIGVSVVPGVSIKDKDMDIIYDVDNGDIDLKIRGGFGCWIIITNNGDENITVDFNITGSGIFSDKKFNDSGNLSVNPKSVALFKRFISGFMRITATVEYEDETLTRSGFSIMLFVIFLP
jgi:hypothetical protein